MGALTFAIPGAIKGALGLGQLIGGSLMKVKRPTYEIPDVAKEELAMSWSYARRKLRQHAYRPERRKRCL
jgi:hypothetical protein